jgi:hypothetical protein
MNELALLFGPELLHFSSNRISGSLSLVPMEKKKAFLKHEILETQSLLGY